MTMTEPEAPSPLPAEAWSTTQALITSRRTVLPKRLQAPGPSEAQLHELLALAAAAPDHGEITPWRFVVVPPEARHRLGEAFARALRERDPAATPQQLDDARDKAHRAPLLLVAIARLGPAQPDTPALERLVSLGAAIQNLLLGAHAMGFGAGLTSGRAMSSPALAALLGLADHEQAVCCVNVGTVARRPRSTRVRPAPETFTRWLPAGD